jgi:PTS system cellobiose-specific IIC component
MLVCLLVASLIWYPFFKVYEKQEMKNEFNEEKAELRAAK